MEEAIQPAPQREDECVLLGRNDASQAWDRFPGVGKERVLATWALCERIGLRGQLRLLESRSRTPALSWRPFPLCLVFGEILRRCCAARVGPADTGPRVVLAKLRATCLDGFQIGCGMGLTAVSADHTENSPRRSVASLVKQELEASWTKERL